MLDQNEKKYIYIAFGLIAILLLIALYIIWSPMFKSGNLTEDIKTYNTISNDQYVEDSKEYYKLQVMNYINKDNYSSLSEKLDENYLEKYNLNIETAKDYLINNNIIKHPSNSMVVYNSKVKTDGKSYIYTYIYKLGNDEKKIHIIEDYYRNYTISFEQTEYPVINKEGHKIDKDGLDINIQIGNSYDNSIVYNVVLNNNTTEEYIIYLNSINDMEAEISNLDVYKLDTVVVGGENSEIKSVPGSSVSFSVALAVPLEQQCDVMNLKFNNVIKSDGSKITLNLDLE